MIPKSYWWVLTAIIKKIIVFLEKKKYLNMLNLISSTHLLLKQTKPTRKSAPCLFTWVNSRFLRKFNKTKPKNQVYGKIAYFSFKFDFIIKLHPHKTARQTDRQANQHHVWAKSCQPQHQITLILMSWAGSAQGHTIPRRWSSPRNGAPDFKFAFLPLPLRGYRVTNFNYCSCLLELRVWSPPQLWPCASLCNVATE